MTQSLKHKTFAYTIVALLSFSIFSVLSPPVGATSAPTTIFSDNFTTWGNWSNVNPSRPVYIASSMLRLAGYSYGPIDSAITIPFDATGSATISADFDLHRTTYDGSLPDTFYLKFYDGSWHTVYTVYLSSLPYNSWAHKTVTLTSSSYTFTTNARFEITLKIESSTAFYLDNMVITSTLAGIHMATDAATNISYDQATLNGHVVYDNGSNIQCGLRWGVNGSGVWSGNTTLVGTYNDGDYISCPATSLTEYTHYMFQSWGKFGSEFKIGATAYFMAEANLSLYADTITATSAKLHGTVGAGIAGNYGFVYGDEDGPPWDHNVTVGTLSTWGYEKQLTISHANNSYQILVNVSKSTGGDVACGGHCQDSFNDIRFLNKAQTVNLSYWIQKVVTGSYAWFWVKLPSTMVADGSIYMKYGNSVVANVSNGDTTFEAFDDFSEATLNTTKWTLVNSSHANIVNTLSTAGGVLSLKSVATATTTGLTYQPYVLRWKAATFPLTSSYQVNAKCRAIQRGFSPSTISNQFPYIKANGTTSSGERMYYFSYLYNSEFFWTSGGSYIDFYDVNSSDYFWARDGIKKTTANISVYDINSGARLGYLTEAVTLIGTARHFQLEGYFGKLSGAYSGTFEQQYDWVFSRKYNTTEPTISVVGAQTRLNTNTTFFYNAAGLNSTSKYYFRLWFQGSYHESATSVFYTLPVAPSAFQILNQHGMDITLEWTNAVSNVPSDVYTILRSKTTGYPTSHTDGTELINTTGEQYSYTIPFSPTGHVYFAVFTFFHGSFSNGTNLSANTTGGTYNFELRYEDSTKNYALMNLNAPATGRYDLVVTYDDLSQERNTYEIGKWSGFNFNTWYSNTFLAGLNISFFNCYKLGGSYIKKVKWDWQSSLLPTINMDVTLEIVDAGTYTVGVTSLLGGMMYVPQTVTLTPGEHTISFPYNIITCPWATAQYGFVVVLVGLSPLTVDWKSTVGSGFPNTIDEHGQQTFTGPSTIIPSALNTPALWVIWTNFLADTHATCSNFRTWWAGWQNNLTVSIAGYNLSQLIVPTIPDGNLCGSITQGWTYTESDLHDADPTDGKWLINSTKTINWCSLSYTSANSYFNITWNTSKYFMRDIVQQGDPITFYGRFDLTYIPYVSDLFKGTGFVQYHIVFAQNLKQGVYANVFIYDKDHNKRIIHSEYLDSNSRISPMLLIHQTYYLELVDTDGIVTNIGPFIAGTNTEISVSAQGVTTDNLIYKNVDITAAWTGTGFTVNVVDRTSTATTIYFTVYYMNGTVAYSTTFAGYSHTFTFIGNVSQNYYYKVDLINIDGYLSTGFVPMRATALVPHVSAGFINALFTVFFGPSVTVGSTTIDWVYIILLVLSLIGLLSVVKGVPTCLIVEGFIFIAGAAVFQLPVLNGVIIGAAGIFLIALGIIGELTEKRAQTNNREEDEQQ